MPVKKRVDKRRAILDEDAADWLRGGDGAAWVYFQTADQLAELWRDHVGEIVAEHVAEHPGTRPARWWERSAPELRRRLGGVGTASHERLATALWPRFGVPRDWIDAAHIEMYAGLGAPLDVPPLDVDDPPIFESQAAYLDRLGLFLPGERRRLKPRNFAPESIIDALGLNRGD